jgi:hypothetical protein
MTGIKICNLNAMLPGVKLLLQLSIIALLVNRCSPSKEGSDKEQQTTNSQSTNHAKNVETTSELTPEQQSAFDALNTLQVSTDEMNLLYSTFAGIDQPCYPPDTSLTILRTELLKAMKQFVARYCTKQTIEERNERAAKSVSAQDEYTVLLCLDDSAPVTYENGAPMAGTWVMPSVLVRRDVIIVC